MATLIEGPTTIQAAGQPPKRIDEFIGLVNSNTAAVSVARMRSPSGWSEPGQTPEFDEYTTVLRGSLHVKLRDQEFDVDAGQAVIVEAGEWVQYSTPSSEGAEYMAVCLPAFSPASVHRDGDESPVKGRRQAAHTALEPRIETRSLFRLNAEVAPPQIVEGPLGKRLFIPVTGGAFRGDRLSGEVQPGGSDFQLIRPDGVAELDVRVTLLTDDGVTIQLKGHGIRHTTPEVFAHIMSGADVDPSEYYFREALFFEAPAGRYEWLNRIIAIAKGGRLKSEVFIDAYEVL